MPFYEYRPKSGDCGICGGCFVDLQKMSEVSHTSCPDCGKACERVLSAPIVSVRGSEYRAAANKENRSESFARAAGDVARLRESTLTKYGQVAGHTHNCALNGCFGEATRSEAEGVAARRFGDLPHLVGAGKK